MIVPSIVGKDGLISKSRVSFYRFRRPGPDVKEARCTPVDSMGRYGRFRARKAPYPQIQGAYLLFDPHIAVPAHLRTDSAKCISVLQGKATIAMYQNARWGNTSIDSDACQGMGDEFLIIPSCTPHAIFVGDAPCLMLVTWRVLGPGGPSPAEWEPATEALIAGTFSAD